MGAKLTSIMCGKKPIRVNLIGDDESGKSTILYTYMAGSDKPLPINHTIGYNIEVITYKNYTFEITDVGGTDKSQPLLYQHLKGKPILIFVIDSSNRNWLDSARHRLYQWTSTNGIENVILLIFANKQDLPNAMTVPEIIDQYKLETLSCRWHVQPCVGTTSEGVSEGFDWLCDNLI